MTYLKYLYDLSDEACVEMFLESGYWQYFCGFEFFQKEFPCDSSSLTRFRNRLGDAGAEKLFQATLKTASDLGLLRAKDCSKVIVDTTVQEKNITFPTDAKLLNKMREKLVDLAQDRGIELRQSYSRVAKILLLRQSRYAHAKQFKRARRATKKLRTILGRVIRDIERKYEVSRDPKIQEVVLLANRLFHQKREDKGKIYSLHEPHVDCISKGKSHKMYEFGCKVGLILSAQKNWILGSHALHGNPFDGKTLKSSIALAERNTGVTVTDAFVDKGYRGVDHHPEHVEVHLSGKKNLDPTRKKLLKRRSAIEPIIGHVKNDHRMNVNLLKGRIGDKLNAVLASSAFNLRKIMSETDLCIKIWLEFLKPNYTLKLEFIEI